MQSRRRVYAYITGPKGVLILAHPEHPEAGLQIPGGTVETDESPQEAVLREVCEETTLHNVTRPVLLGRHSFDMREYGIDEQQDAWFYQMKVNQETADSWFHEERFGANQKLSEPIPFRLYWAKLPYEGKPLIAHHGQYLNNLAVENLKGPKK